MASYDIYLCPLQGPSFRGGGRGRLILEIENKVIDFQIDMWSLGCLLAECYTGEPLFVGKTKEDILAKVGLFLF